MNCCCRLVRIALTIVVLFAVDVLSECTRIPGKSCACEGENGQVIDLSNIKPP